MADPRPAWIDLRRYVVGMPPGAAPRIFVAAGSSAVLLAFSLERWRTGGILLLALWATRRLL